MVGPPPGSGRRARRVFWVLVLVAVLAAGSLTAGLTAEAAPATGLRVGVSGLVLIAAITLATRVMRALDRAHRGPRPPGPSRGRRLQ